jgi:ABC-type transporter Mla subunit MlaD
MSEDVFRIIVTAAVALAAVAFIVQAALMAGLYRAVRKMQARTDPLAAEIQAMVQKAAPVIEKIGPVIDKIGPVIGKIGPVIDKIGPVIDKIGPVIDQAGPLVARADKVLETTQLILDENRPKVAEITGDAARVMATGRRQVELVGELLQDAGDRVRIRLEQIDRSVDGAVEQAEHVGDAMKRAVTRPGREVNGIAAGISAAISALMHGRKYPVDRTTQDEEMFI